MRRRTLSFEPYHLLDFGSNILNMAVSSSNDRRISCYKLYEYEDLEPVMPKAMSGISTLPIVPSFRRATFPFQKATDI